MRIADRLRAAWSSVTRSPRRTAVAVAGVIGALAVGVGFSLAVNAVRDGRVAERPAASADATADPSASVDASRTLSPLATASPSVTPSATPTATPTPTPTPTATPVPTPAPTPHAVPTVPATAACDEITMDASGAVYVNGVAVEDPWEDEYGEQMPMALLRLAARADGAPGATACLEVALPKVDVSGEIAICGDVLTQRLEPMPTPTPQEPEPTMPPQYGEPTISGVTISDRMLDVNSYPLLEVADVADVPACLEITSGSNDVYLTISLAVCATVLLADDGSLTITIGDQSWSFTPESVFDDEQLLPMGAPTDVGLIVRNFRDDVIHLIELAVWTTADCP